MSAQTGGGYPSKLQPSWEHRKTSKIIWYHPENNWGPFIENLVKLEEDFNSRKKSSENSRKTSSENSRKTVIDNLVQFEEDSNSRTEKLHGGGGDRLSQTRPIPRSPDGVKNYRSIKPVNRKHFKEILLLLKCLATLRTIVMWHTSRPQNTTATVGQGALKLDIHFDFLNSTIAANSKLANSDINNIVININIIINTNNTATELNW